MIGRPYLLASAGIACVLACEAAPRRPEGAATSGRTVIATFTGEADPVTGAIRVTPDAPGVARAALTELPVVQDGLPGTGPADTVELVSEAASVVGGRCGAASAFEGAVRVRSFYGAKTLSNVHAEILKITPSGHESCRSAQPPLGASAANGLFAYPSLTAAGTPRDSALATWSFRLPDMAPFAFQGRVVADVLTPCTGTAMFGTPISTIAGGTAPNNRQIATADFDGDGKLDVAILSGPVTTGNATIYRGLGDGRFTYAYEVRGGAALAAADVTGDGKPDLLVANGTNVNVYRNLGTYLTSTAVAIATGGDASELAVGDLTGDGRPDLAVIDYGGKAVRTFANTGAVGTVAFSARGSQAVTGSPRAVAIADVSGDGRGDVVAAVEATNSVAVLLGAGDGTVLAPSYQPVSSVPYVLRVADLDGDGRPDLVLYVSGTVATLRNLGAGAYPAPVSFAAPVATAITGSVYDLRLGDLNADGRPDVLVSISSAHALGVLLNDGAGGLAPAVTHPAGASTYANAYGVALGDWNGDGRLDAAVVDNVNPYLYAYLGRGDGTLQAGTELPVGTSPQRVLAGDLDGDGDVDLVTIEYTTYGSATILKNDGSGAFAARGLDLVTAYAWDGVLADVNGDRVPDLIVIHGPPALVSVFLGRGDGTFGSRTTYPVGASPQAIAVGDLDGDLDLDLAVVSSTGKRVDLLLGRGDGTFLPVTPIPLPAPGYGIAIGDVDGDGVTDLAVALSSSGVRVYRGTGAGAFGTPASYPITTSRVLLADLTNDGRPELVALHGPSYPTGVGVSRNTGSGAFPSEALYATGLSWPAGVVAADLDGDGSLDLAVTDGGTSGNGFTVATLRNAGDGTFPVALTWQTGISPGQLAAADLDGDGRNDLAVPSSNGSRSTVSILRSTCW